MALEGTIKEFGLADIFQLIGLQKKTGILFLKGIDNTINIHFEDGMVVKTEDSQKRPKYLFGNILISRGKINESQFSEALEIQKNTMQKIGHILVGRGLITKADLRETLSFQMSETIYKVFRWKGGDYKFYQDKVDYDRDTVIPISSEHILMDGIRMLDEWPIIEQGLPDHDTILTAKPSAAIDEEFAGEDIFGGFEKSNDTLSKESIQILKLINGRRSIYEIIEFSGLGEFDTCKALVDLLDKGYIFKSSGSRKESIVGDITVPIEKTFTLPLKIAKFSYIAIVLALLIVFAQVTGTRKIMNPRQSGFRGLKESFAISQVKMLDNNLSLYYMDSGAYPATLTDLMNLDYVPTGEQADPWGNNLSIVPAADNDLAVVSPGPDRTLNTQDDIASHP
jgi:hypothetical protein